MSQTYDARYHDWEEWQSETVHLPHNTFEKKKEVEQRQEQLLREDEERDAAIELARTIDEIIARRGV